MSNYDREFADAVKQAGGAEAFSLRTGMSITAILFALDEVEARDPVKAIRGKCAVCQKKIETEQFADHTAKTVNGEIIEYVLAHIQCAINDNIEIGYAFWYWEL